MRRRELIVGGGTAAAAAFAGCLGSAQSGDETDRQDGSTRSIIVNKTGRAESEPDLAVLQIGVEATGESASDVRDELAARSEELRDALVAFGLDEDDITTSRFHVRERIDRERMRREGAEPETREEAEEYTYYEGTHSFRVEVHDVDEAGEVVDAAVDAGANDIGHIQFTLSDERRDELRQEALEEAIEDARSEADFVAGEIDASVVEVKVIDTSGGDVRPVHDRVEMEAVAADSAPSTEFQPDDVTVTASVEVKYRMA